MGREGDVLRGCGEGLMKVGWVIDIAANTCLGREDLHKP